MQQDRRSVLKQLAAGSAALLTLPLQAAHGANPGNSLPATIRIGVAQLDRNWLLLVKSLSATRSETILRLTLPAITSHVLTGVRLAIGIIWIVLVPAEMLGVSAGLGYFILDTRDRLAYSELMAAIVLVGVLGFVLDQAARLAYRAWLHGSQAQ